EMGPLDHHATHLIGIDGFATRFFEGLNLQIRILVFCRDTGVAYFHAPIMIRPYETCNFLMSWHFRIVPKSLRSGIVPERGLEMFIFGHTASCAQRLIVRSEGASPRQVSPSYQSDMTRHISPI